MLPPRPHEVESVYAEEPQAVSETEERHQGAHEYAAPSTFPPRFPPAHPSRDLPVFEQGSSRGGAGVYHRRFPTTSDRPFDEERDVRYTSYSYPPPSRSHVGHTDPTSYAYSQHPPAYSGSATLSYPPPSPPQLPPLRVVEEEVGIAPGALPVRHTRYAREDPRPTLRYIDARAEHPPGSGWGNQAWEVRTPQPTYAFDSGVLHESLHAQAQRAQPWNYRPRSREGYPDPRRSTATHRTSALSC